MTIRPFGRVEACGARQSLMVLTLGPTTFNYAERGSVVQVQRVHPTFADDATFSTRSSTQTMNCWVYGYAPTGTLLEAYNIGGRWYASGRPFIPVLTNGISSLVSEMDGNAQLTLWSSSAASLTGIVPNEVCYGSDERVYAVLKSGHGSYPGKRLFKFNATRTGVDWARGIGSVDSGAFDASRGLDDFFSLAVTADDRVLAVMYDSKDTNSAGNVCMMSFDSSGALEWHKVQQDFSPTFRPFCVRALQDGTAWFIGPSRLVHCDVDGAVLQNITTPPASRGNGTFLYGTGDISPTPDNLLAVILHETITNVFGTNFAAKHSLLLVDQFGASTGLVTLSDTSAIVSNGRDLSGDSGAMPRGVTATASDFLIAYPLIGRATTSSLLWSVTPAAGGSGYGRAAVDGSDDHSLYAETNPFYPSLSSDPFICVGRSRTDGSAFTIGTNQYGFAARNSLERLRVGIA